MWRDAGDRTSKPEPQPRASAGRCPQSQSAAGDIVLVRGVRCLAKAPYTRDEYDYRCGCASRSFAVTTSFNRSARRML